jgi:dihydropteroate synthase
LAASARARSFRPAPVKLARGRILPLGERTLVMGVINVTPDSFYPGSRAPGVEQAVERALALAAEGADIVDIGGESTRPGAAEVAPGEELARVLPVVEAVRRQSDVALSIDTTRSAVAQAALAAGADIVNDVSGFSADPTMAGLIGRSGAIAILMHTRGTPRTMNQHARYEDVVLQVKAELGARVAAAVRAGIPDDRLWIDPGLGFAKNARHTLEILSRLEEFELFEKPLVIGASRKSFIGRVLGEPDPAARLEGSLAVAVAAVLKGAHILRVHDVAATIRVARIAEAIREPERLAEAEPPPASGG